MDQRQSWNKSHRLLKLWIQQPAVVVGNSATKGMRGLKPHPNEIQGVRVHFLKHPQWIFSPPIKTRIYFSTCRKSDSERKHKTMCKYLSCNWGGEVYGIGYVSAWDKTHSSSICVFPSATPFLWYLKEGWVKGSVHPSADKIVVPCL